MRAAPAMVACLLLAGCGTAPDPSPLRFLEEGPVAAPAALEAWVREPCDPRPGSLPSGSLRMFPRFQDPTRDQVTRLLSQLGQVKRLDNFGGPDWTSNLGAVHVDSLPPGPAPFAISYRLGWYNREPTWDAARVQDLAEGIARAWGIPDSIAASFHATTDANGLGRLEHRQPPPYSGSLAIATSVRTDALADDGRDLGTWYEQTIRLYPFQPENHEGWPVARDEAAAIAQQTLDCLAGGQGIGRLTPEAEMGRAASSLGHVFATGIVADATRPPCEVYAITVDAITGAVLKVHRDQPYRYVPGCAAVRDG
jgi:hypothetical protein